MRRALILGLPVGLTAMMLLTAIATVTAQSLTFSREAEDALRVLEFTKPWDRQPLFALRQLTERFTRLADQAALAPDLSPDPMRGAQLRRRLIMARDQLVRALADAEWAALPREVAATIQERCEQDWPKDFAMRAVCQRQQVEGWYQLRR